jgi:Uma2 family endonuclease
VRKQATYARFGVREYWIVDPFDETIEVFSLEGNVYRVADIIGKAGVAVSPGIPELRVPAARIFDLS